MPTPARRDPKEKLVSHAVLQPEHAPERKFRRKHAFAAKKEEEALRVTVLAEERLTGERGAPHEGKISAQATGKTGCVEKELTRPWRYSFERKEQWRMGRVDESHRPCGGVGKNNAQRKGTSCKRVDLEHEKKERLERFRRFLETLGQTMGKKTGKEKDPKKKWVTKTRERSGALRKKTKVSRKRSGFQILPCSKGKLSGARIGNSCCRGKKFQKNPEKKGCCRPSRSGKGLRRKRRKINNNNERGKKGTPSDSGSFEMRAKGRHPAREIKGFLERK